MELHGKELNNFVIDCIGLELTQGGSNLITFEIYDGHLELYRDGTLHELCDPIGKFINGKFTIIDNDKKYEILLFKQKHNF